MGNYYFTRDSMCRRDGYCIGRETMKTLLLILTYILSSALSFPPPEKSCKKGVADSPRDYVCGDLKRLHDNGVCWWYDWSTPIAIEKIKDSLIKDCFLEKDKELGFERVPMVWGWNENRKDKILQKLMKEIHHHNADYVLLM